MTGHTVALSLNDLSVWCYKCNKYLKSSKLENTLDVASWHKHREKKQSLINNDTAAEGTRKMVTNRTAVCYDKKGTEKHCPDVTTTGLFALECPDRTQKAIEILSEKNILSK